MDGMDEIIKEFIIESREGLDQVDRDLVELEKLPGDMERVARIFRAIHTLKGTSGVLGFQQLESIAHVGENLLSHLRDRTLTFNGPIVDSLLELVDVSRILLTDVEQKGAETERDCIAVLSNLKKQLDVSNTVEPAVTNTILSTTESRRDSQITSTDAQLSSTIRVDVGLIDKVMTLVGELVLARNQVLQLTSSEKEQGLIQAAQRLNLITSELQEAVMKTRMQPIGNVWNKLPRVVRDLATAFGKKIRLELEGSDTELDKTIIEAIKDPLTHIIRNSIDHGIEVPEIRLKSGKAAEGLLKVRAFHEGGQVNIEITDDGAGIDLGAVKKRAQEKGLLTSEQARNISERELTAMIFQPGFSTAAKVTNVSGRGVGMDVVRTNIERIGGTVDIQSIAGDGTTLRMKIPLTLAIIPALIASSAGERFAIPQVSLVELVRLSAEEAKSAIEHIQGVPVYRLRGRLLPLLYLEKELQLELQNHDGAVNIAVLQSDNHQFGLIVDKINDTEEIVVKPLGKLLKGLSCFAGATVMGDGRVALILDIVGLAQHANLVADTASSSTKTTEVTGAVDQSTAWLLFRVGARKMAMPLAEVARLEEFSVSMIERSGSGEVVQYRNEIMPVIRVANVLGEPSCAKQSVHVIVTVLNKRSVGLIVDEIQDVIQQDLRVEPPQQGAMILGSAVIHDHVTDLLEVGSLISSLRNAGTTSLIA